MTIGARRSSGQVTAGFLAIGIAWTAWAPSLAAQAAQAERRAGRATPAETSRAPTEARLAPAKSVLRTLVGTWRFEIRFAGNFDGAPDVSGTRVLKPLYDDLRLEWTETLDHSAVQGQGVVAFDPRSARFFSSAVYSAGSAPEFMTGTLDSGEPLITFKSMVSGQDSTTSFALNLLDDDHFTVAALDRAWRALFTRQK